MNELDLDKWIAAASLLSMGMAAFGVALGQGRAMAAAMDGMTRNPGAVKQTLPAMIIGLAMIEALVIYLFVLCAMYFGKLG